MLALTHAPSPQMDACELTYIARAPVDHALAARQHADYCQMLQRCGAEVHRLTANLALPDCAFIEDTAIVLDEIAVLASMGAASRRAEPPGIEPELRKYREVVRVELPATIEGGDVLRVGRKLLVGLSSRTNRAGVDALAGIVRRHGYEVVPVPLHGCLHLKSACTALPDQSLLVNPAWLDTGALRGFELVPVPKAEPWAADVLSIGNCVCLTNAFPQTAAMILARDFEVCTVDLSEFAKAEGAVTCLSIVFPSSAR
jgi:dimethylargininase